MERVNCRAAAANLVQFQPTDFCDHSLEEIVPSTVPVLCLRENNLELPNVGE